MLPWEHLLFGYVWYSVLNRLVWHRPIGDGEALTVVLATQAPDLLDKTLSWTLGLTATGYGPAHSLLVGAPIVTLVAGLAWTRDRARLGSALFVAYASHLVGDALALRANGPTPGRLLWPLVTYDPYETNLGFVERTTKYLGEFVVKISNPENVVLVVGYVAVLSSVTVLWALDGTPGIRWARRVVGADR
ncbi:metal-dependent hydrolase [Haloferax sp. DFSO52]|uniref:metal-dependent hydrolase n=1 Tax=Haloferax sp. DFSO52 TaxID=3388505 RepID=UPI003A8BF575